MLVITKHYGNDKQFDNKCALISIFDNRKHCIVFSILDDIKNKKLNTIYNWRHAKINSILRNVMQPTYIISLGL